MSSTTSIFLFTLLLSFAAVTMAQKYTIYARVNQGDTKNSFTVVEKTSWWYSNGCTWAESGGRHSLTMGASGTSGILRFKNPANEYFLVALGVHDHVRWCDIITDAKSSDTGVLVHPTYYSDQEGNRAAIRQSQLAHLEKWSSTGMIVTVDYFSATGRVLQATISIGYQK